MATATTIDPASPRFDAGRVGGDAPYLQRGAPALRSGLRPRLKRNVPAHGAGDADEFR